jgi:ribonuclease HI
LRLQVTDISPTRNISERLQGETQTNQRAELTAILRALETVDLAQDLEIRTDSKYSIQCVTEWYINWERNGWKTRAGPVKNQDLVQLVRDKIEEREAKGGRTQFIWVKGHDTDQGNIAADRLAVAGAMK